MRNIINTAKSFQPTETKRKIRSSNRQGKGKKQIYLNCQRRTDEREGGGRIS